MAKKLHKLLAKQEESLVDSIIAGLDESDAVHYRQVDPQLLRTQVARVVDAFLESLEGTPESFVDFVRRLNEERLAEGYYLHEIQTALNVLDEKACAISLEHSAADKVDKHLLRISRTISLAKDQLALSYFLKRQEADTRVAALERRLQELGKGTDQG